MAFGIMVLSDELLLAMLRQIAKSDLKEARLACRRWSRIGAELLFQQVYFAPRDEEMQLFVNITSHPIFSRAITEVIYDGRLYISAYTDARKFVSQYHLFCIPNDVPDFDAYVNSELEFAEQAVADGNGEAQEYARAKEMFVRYSDALSAQEDILANGKDLEVLYNALKRMSNVTTLSLLDNFDSDRTRIFSPFEKAQHLKYLTRATFKPQPSGWTDRAGWNDVESWERRESPEWDVRGIYHLFAALSKCCCLIKRVKMGYPSSFLPMQIFRPASPPLRYLQHVASSLVEFGVEYRHRA